VIFRLLVLGLILTMRKVKRRLKLVLLKKVLLYKGLYLGTERPY
jgi:hypothetical protein